MICLCDDYIKALRSFVVAHPLSTSRHSKYGLDGNYICVDIAVAIFEPYGGFGQLKSLQVQGEAVMVEPFSEEYLMLMEHKKIPVEAMKKLPQAMNLIKVAPTSYDYLDSDLKNNGFGSRQHLEV